MAWVRKTRTKSGTTVAQIVQKKHGRLRIIKHLGSAHTPVKVAVLVKQANQLLQGNQETLDLGIDPVPDIEQPGQPAQQQQPLFVDESTTPPGATSQPPVTSDGPPIQLVPAVSDVLWKTLRAAYAHLGFDALSDEVFEKVMLAQLVEPTSKLGISRVLQGLGMEPPHHTTIYRHLAQAQDQDYRHQIAKACFGYSTHHRDLA